jgi:predicted ABC-type ATPase
LPTLTIIAGPNGSGKSTLTNFFEFEGRERLLDPDAIAVRLNPLSPSASAIAAGREVLQRTEEYVNSDLTQPSQLMPISH